MPTILIINHSLVCNDGVVNAQLVYHTVARWNPPHAIIVSLNIASRSQKSLPKALHVCINVWTCVLLFIIFFTQFYEFRISFPCNYDVCNAQNRRINRRIKNKKDSFALYSWVTLVCKNTFNTMSNFDSVPKVQSW